jgi:hypothetical protein
MACVAFGGEDGADVAIELHPFGGHRCETRQKPDTQAEKPGRCDGHGEKLLGSISLDFSRKGKGVGKSSRLLEMMIQVGQADMSRLGIRERDRSLFGLAEGEDMAPNLFEVLAIVAQVDGDCFG